MPPMALRLVNYYTRHDLSAVFGRDWHKFGIYQGRLVCDLFPDGITPTQLRKLFFMARDNQLARKHEQNAIHRPCGGK
jgi:hypothetical protein